MIWTELEIPIEDLWDPILPLEATFAVPLVSVQVSKFSAKLKRISNIQLPQLEAQ